MADPNFIVLYVSDPQKSAAFYTDLLGHPVIESSANFAGVPLKDDMLLGLWRRPMVEPAATGASGASEIGLTLGSREAVEALHKDWTERGVKMAQAPTDMDFGRTFVALDPDGHRLRVMYPNQV